MMLLREFFFMVRNLSDSQCCVAKTCAFTYHDVFQLHVQQVGALHVLLPGLRILSVVHVVQYELEENDLLGHRAEAVVEAEHVVSLLGLHSEERCYEVNTPRQGKKRSKKTRV